MWCTPHAVEVGRSERGFWYFARIGPAFASKSVCWAVIVRLHASVQISVPRPTYQPSALIVSRQVSRQPLDVTMLRLPSFDTDRPPACQRLADGRSDGADHLQLLE